MFLINFNIFHQQKSVTKKLQKKKNAEMTDCEPPKIPSHPDYRKLKKVVYIKYNIYGHIFFR